MEIKWLRKALSNLTQEADYITKTDPGAAKNVVESITSAIDLLANNPALGHPGRSPGTRELIVSDTRYIVPYRVNARLKRIEILRVFHSSRKLPESW